MKSKFWLPKNLITFHRLKPIIGNGNCDHRWGDGEDEYSKLQPEKIKLWKLRLCRCNQCGNLVLIWG